MQDITVKDVPVLTGFNEMDTKALSAKIHLRNNDIFHYRFDSFRILWV